MTVLLRQSVYSRLAGYEDVNDAERLGVDPVIRQVVGRAITRTAASTSQVGRFETEVLAHPNNLATLMAIPWAWVDRVRERRPMKTLILDLDRSATETSCFSWPRSPCRAGCTRPSLNGYDGSRRSRRGHHRHDGADRSSTESTARGVGCHFVQITSKRPARASGAVLSPASRPFSTQISSASEQIGLQCRKTGVMLVQNGPAMVPGEGHLGNVG